MARSAILAVKIVGDASGASKAFGTTQKDLDNLQSGFDGLVGPASVASAAIVAGAGYAAKAASDLAESQSKVSVVFGDSAGAIEQWASTAATSLGMSQQAALDAAGSFGTMFTQLGFTSTEAAGMATSMVDLSADLASFHNVAGGAAQVTDMMSAAMRGEYDSIQALIPTINAKAVQDAAMAATGKTSAAALTEQEKAAATLQLIMEDAGPAVGDFARTQDGAANSTRIAKASFEDAAAQLGTALIPMVTAAAGALTNLAKWISENQRVVLILTGAIAGLAAGILIAKALTTAWTIATNAAKVAMGIARAATLAYSIATNAYAIAAMLAAVAEWAVLAPIVLIVAGIAAVVAIIILAVKNWDKIMSAFKSGAAWLKNVFVGAWDAVVNAISRVIDWFQRLWDKAKAVWDGIAGIIDKVNPFAGSATVAVAGMPPVPATYAAPRSGGGQTVNVTFTGLVTDPEGTARQIRRILAGSSARTGSPALTRARTW